MTDPAAFDFEGFVREAVRQPQASPEFVDQLWTSLTSQPAYQPSLKKRFFGSRRPTWQVVIPIVLAIVTLLALIGPQRVLAAIQALFDYLPGVGAINDLDQAQVLAGPVATEREGITITVENLVAASDRTWLRLKVEGWTPDPQWAEHPADQGRGPVLMLPSGAQIASNQSDIYQGEALYAEYQFAPLPPGAGQVTLALDRLPQALQGRAPQAWTFTLPLRRVTAQDALPEAWQDQLDSVLLNGVQLSLLQIIQSSSQTLLTVRLQTPTLNAALDPEWTSQLSLQDAQGQIYPLNLVRTQGERTATFSTRAFRTEENLTLRLERLLLIEDQPSRASAPSFTFDPGANPQLGQHWALDEWLAPPRFRLHVVGADLETDRDGQLRLVLTLERPEAALRGVMLDCRDPICAGAQTDDLANPSSPQFHPFLLLKSFPQGKLQIALGNLYYALAGPWEVQWQAQAMPAPAQTSTPLPTPRPTMMPLPEPTPATQPEGVGALILKGYQALYGQPGWVHLLSESIEPESSPEYQSGKIGPAHSFDEAWQYIEADGAVGKEVWIGKSAEGAVWRQVARVGPTQVDFTAGTSVDNPNLVARPQMDDLGDTVANAGEHHLRVIQEETLLDERPCLLVRVVEGFDPPMSITSIPKPVSRSEGRTWIDRESGQILQYQTVYTLEDGTELITQTLRFLVKERIDTPPQEALDLLARVVP